MKLLKLITIAAGIATSISCFAQGGGSVNGPDLKGSMIPVYSDGEIPAEKLTTTMEYCFYKRMGAQIMESILGRPVILKTPMNTTRFGEYRSHQQKQKTTAPSLFYNTTEDSGYYGSTQGIIIQSTDSILMKPKLNIDYRYEFSISQASKFEAGTFSGIYIRYSFENFSAGDSRYINLTSANFPYLSYELNDKSIYGEMGELIEKKMFVSNLRFNFKPNTTQTVFQLNATRADGQVVPSAIKIDSLDLIECVKSNLAK